MIVTKLELTYEVPDGFVPIDNYPYRGPLSVAEALIPFVNGKVFCDLGCGAGDIAELLVPYAKKVYGVEYKAAPVRRGSGRGFEMIQGDYFENMPEADVYYVWNMGNLKMAEMFKDKKETLIVGGAKRVKIVDGKRIERIAETIRILYNEFNATIYEFDSNDEVKLHPSSRAKAFTWECPWHLAVM